MILRGTIQAVRVEQRNQVFVDVLTYANSVNKNVPLFAQFGIASVPKIGTRCICIALGGDYEALIAIAAQSMTNDGELSEGQTQLGTDDATIKITDQIELNANVLRGTFSGELNLSSNNMAFNSNGQELLAILIELCSALQAAPALGAVNAAGNAARASLVTFKGT